MPFPGRLLLFFQPHGYGPLRIMGAELTDTFAREMAPDDVLIMPDPVYYGGTTDRSVGSDDRHRGDRRARPAGRACRRTAPARRRRALLELARPGDRIVIMGARDDTLTLFAEEVLARLARLSADDIR